MSGAPGRTSMTVGRDYNSASAYEFVIMASVGPLENDDWRIVARKGGFRSAATARSAGRRAYEGLTS